MSLSRGNCYISKERRSGQEFEKPMRGVPLNADRGAVPGAFYISFHPKIA